jgi:hypothetical protein
MESHSRNFRTIFIGKGKVCKNSNQLLECITMTPSSRISNSFWLHFLSSQKRRPALVNCSRVFWLMDPKRCICCISSSTSLNASFTVIATLVRSHSPRMRQRQSIKQVLICSNCSTEQPLVRWDNWSWSFSTYGRSMTISGLGSVSLSKP